MKRTLKSSLILLPALLLFAAGLTYGQNINSGPAVVLPASGSTSYTSPSGQTTITSTVGVTLNPGVVLSSSNGSTVSIGIAPPPLNNISVNITQNLNYIITYTPRIAGLTTPAAVTNVNYDPTQVQTTIQYFDGLGRPIQTVQAKASPWGNDVIQPIAYDQESRDSVKYLPYTVATSTPGFYQPTAINGSAGYSNSQQYQFYQQAGQGYVNTQYPYAGTNYEPSELNRPVEQGAPGTSWQLSTAGVTGGGHTVQTIYTTNNSIAWATDPVNSRQVAWYNTTVNSDQSRTLVANGYYPTNVLTVTVVMDENWTSANGRAGTTEEYKDIEGHVVLKRQYNNNNGTMQVLSTYYVYDDFGDLAFVLPPALGADAVVSFTTTQLCNLGYQYRYDERGRMAAKKVPGKGWEFMVYNTIDQVVMTQDANQRNQTPQQWTFTKYDGKGRAIVTGMYTAPGSTADNSVTAPSLSGQQSLDTLYATTAKPKWENRNNTTATGYDGKCDPVDLTGQNYTYYTVNFYDDYSGSSYFPTTFTQPANASVQTRGLPTATFTNVLGTPTMLATVHYYDDLGRSIQTYQQHYLGGILSNNNYDVITNTYNFTNAPTTTIRQHWNTNSTTAPLVTISNTYYYDQVGRKLSTWEQITNGSSTPTPAAKTLISKVTYNEIGQVISKNLQNLHSTDSLNFLQNIAYNYNERGWLLGSTAPLFQMQLQYNTSYPGQGNVLQYNGNISTQSWGTAAAPNTTVSVYLYDNLNRLTSANNTAGYTENNINYDLMGNITQLYRYTAGATMIDELAYGYAGGTNASNQLISVLDNSGSNAGLVNGTTSYAWDNNGNMLSSSNTTTTTQNKAFTYNLLNLPITAAIANGTATYIYDASGNKLRKVDVLNGVTKTTEYISGIEYDNSSTAIGFIQTEEGKAVPTTTGGYDYTYYLGDNLGNTRVTFDTQTGVAFQLQRDDYYAFGMEINSLTNSPKNEYLYNGKELQEETGLYDYGHRQYDPVIGRFTSIDKFAEKYKAHSSYVYTLDNPIKTIDINGDSSVVLNAPHGANGEGHIAQLIQNPNGTYSLYSKNGTNESSGLSGPNDKDGGNQVGKGSFKSPKEFMNSSLNPVINKKTGEKEYAEGYLIPATKEQDKQNIAGEKKVLSEPYDVLDSSCGTAVQSGLKAEGKNDGSLTPLQFLGVALESLSTGPAVENDKSPNEIYKRVKENNKGKVVTPGN